MAGAERFRVPVETRAPSGATNAYLVDGLLVDPAARTDALDEAVAAGRVADVAVTHTHPDHVGAAAAYAAEADATLWAYAPRMERFERTVGVAPDRTFGDGDAVGPVRAVATPGHASDHVGFAVDGDDGERRLLCGDLAVAEGSVVVGAPDGDVRAYLTSLRRVAARGYAALLPGHGPEIDAPATTLERLVRHRLDRERRVAAAVEAGADGVDAVLAAAYDKDLAGVEDLARATTVAHLEKLARAGRIDRAWLDRLPDG